jgi:hypothetical protein
MSLEKGSETFLYLNGVKVGKEVEHSLGRSFSFLEKAGRSPSKEFVGREATGTVPFSILVDKEVSNSFLTFMSLAENFALGTFKIWSGVSGDVEIIFQAFIEDYQKTASGNGVSRYQANLKMNGKMEILTDGAFQAESTNIDEISVYSAETGVFSYTLRNTSAGTTQSGNLTFSAPAEVGGFEDGLFKATLGSLVSGTKYELKVGLSSTPINVITQFNIPMGASDQHLLSSAEGDYLTKTGINTYALPKTVEQVEINGTANDYSGGGNDGAVKNSPAASFALSATLTFSNTAPYSRPTAVTINKSDGVVAGSYDSGTGVFTISAAGRIDSLTVDGEEVLLCANVGNVQQWKIGSTQYLITFSAVTWVLTNSNAILQAIGGNKLALGKSFTVGSTSGTYTKTNNILTFVISCKNLINAADVGLGTSSQLMCSVLNGSTFHFISTGYAAGQTKTSLTLSTTAGSLSFPKGSEAKTFAIEIDLDAETVKCVADGQIVVGSGTLNYATLRSYTFDRFACGGGFASSQFHIAYDRMLIYDTPTSILNTIDTTKFFDRDYPTLNLVFEALSENQNVGNFNINGVDYAIPTANAINDYPFFASSALNANGNPTGFDALGNPLPEGYSDRLFDFGNSLEWQTGSPVTDTYVALPPPTVSNTEYGTEYTTETPNSKSDLFYFPSGASAAVEAEIEKLQGLANDPAPKIIKRS